MQVVITSHNPEQDKDLGDVMDIVPRFGLTLGNTNYRDVQSFHEKFDVPVSPSPALLSESTFEFRVKFLREELTEFKESHASGDLLGAADALIDLVYVAMGTAHMMGLPWQTLWEEVQRANMSKVRATDPSQSKRNTALDVIKPSGWKAPDHSQFIGDGPWPTF